jgi:hypothetical protein
MFATSAGNFDAALFPTGPMPLLLSTHAALWDSIAHLVPDGLPKCQIEQFATEYAAAYLREKDIVGIVARTLIYNWWWDRTAGRSW